MSFFTHLFKPDFRSQKYSAVCENNGTGCFPSPRDKRDYQIKDILATAKELPSFCTLPISPVKNQGSTNSCTGFATTAAFETLRMLKGTGVFDCSELFTYYHARKRSNLQDQDGGAYLRDALQSAVEQGIALEDFWTFNTERVNVPPSWVANVTARLLRIKAYYRCNNLFEVKSALNNSMPVVLVLRLRTSFYDVTRNGVYEGSGDLTGGYHAMLCYGYDDGAKVLRIKNSWGYLYGQQGLLYLPYSVLARDGVESWSVSA